MMAEPFRKSTLPNGIRVLSENVDSVRSLSLGIWVLAGSRHETPQTNGIAHLIEHMVFKGTEKRNAFQIAHAIESLGGGINAFTDKNLTCYYVRLMGEHMETGLDVLADLVAHPTLQPAELEREKGVISEEIREVEDTPSELIHDLFARNLFREHPLGLPVQGSVESVSALQVDDLHRFRVQNYSADKMVVAAAGMIDHERLLDLVWQKLADRPTGDGKENTQTMAPLSAQRFESRKTILQSHIMIGRRIFARNDPRRYSLAILNVVLSGGMSSRLFQNIREKYGFVYAIFAFSELFLSQGMFGIYAGVDTAHLEEVAALIYEELRKLAEGRLSMEELQKVREQFKGGMILSLEAMQARMNRMARMEIYEKQLLTIDELLQLIEAVSLEDIQDLARYLYDRDQFIETVLLPDEALL